MKSIIACCVLVLMCLATRQSFAIELNLNPPDTHKIVGDLSDILHIGIKTKSIVGQGWVSRLEVTHSLVGWKGHVDGIAIKFVNPQILNNGVPVSFRITRTNRDKVIPTPRYDLNDDVALSVTDVCYWYCSPGSYGAVYPEQWKRTLEKLCEYFKLPKAVSGITCTVYGDRWIIPTGNPIPVEASLETLSGVQSNEGKLPKDWIRYLIVTDHMGNRLSPRIPSEIDLIKKKRLQNPNILKEDLRYGQDVGLVFDMSKPDIYKIRLVCPLENDEKTIVESRDISVRIVPIDFVQLTLKKLYPSDNIKTEKYIPAEITLNVREGNLGQFQDIKLHCSASKTPPVFSPYGYAFDHYYKGICENVRIDENIKGILHPSKNACYQLEFDFADGLWYQSISSDMVGPSIWDHTKPGETWYLWVAGSATIDGRYLNLISNRLEIHVVKSTTDSRQLFIEKPFTASSEYEPIDH